MDIGSYIMGEMMGLIGGILIFAIVLAFKNSGKNQEKIDMSDNERLIIFDITEIDGTYDITTKDSRALGYGCRGLPSTEMLVTMQEMSKWLHDWAGFDVVFAFEVD